MILVISSPSRSTSGFFTLILAMARFLRQSRAGSPMLSIGDERSTSA